MTWELFLRLLVAAALGAIIGIDREYRAKEAGFRTHFLVALGSALFMIVSKYGFDDLLTRAGVGLDPSRIASQVVTGIGFLGAGTIIIQRLFVRGLTTAAGIWATAAIGLTVGAGMYALGLLATLLTLLGLEGLGHVFREFSQKNINLSFTLPDNEAARRVMAELEQTRYTIISYSAEPSGPGDNSPYRVTLVVRTRKLAEERELIRFLQDIPGTVINKIE